MSVLLVPIVNSTKLVAGQNLWETVRLLAAIPIEDFLRFIVG